MVDCEHMHVVGIQSAHGMWFKCKDCGAEHVWEKYETDHRAAPQ